MTWGAIGGAAVATIGGAMLNSDSPSGSATSTNKIELDPRMRELLFGTGRTLKPGVKPIYGPSTEATKRWLMDGLGGAEAGAGDGHWETVPGKQGQQINPDSDYINDTGLIGKITGLLDRPQNTGIANFGTIADNYLGKNGANDLTNMRDTSNELMRSLWLAPQMTSAQIGNVDGMHAAQVSAPSQNNTNLAPAYQDMIYGQPGNNPYLTGAIQRGINQSNNAFSDMLSQATRNITENVMPSIRSGAIVNGAMGGSRQGIAEGKALNDFSTQMGQALQRFGQGNTDAAVSAQAGQYDADRNRALSAMSGLSGNQYNTAFQDAGYQQDANRTNYQGDLQRALAQAQLDQNASTANQNAQLGTNQLNVNRQLGGLSAGSGLLGQTYGFGTNADAYTGNKVGQVAGLLSPFTGLGASSASTQPLYSNTGAGILGGAMLGQQLGKGFGSGGGYSSWMNGNVNNTGIGASDLLSSF